MASPCPLQPPELVWVEEEVKFKLRPSLRKASPPNSCLQGENERQGQQGLRVFSGPRGDAVAPGGSASSSPGPLPAPSTCSGTGVSWWPWCPSPAVLCLQGHAHQGWQGGGACPPKLLASAPATG